MKTFSILVLLCCLKINLASAHGEGKLGPNNGYIRMPGAFHVELAPSTDGSFMVYLMNVNNQEPVTINSSVVLSYKNKNKTSAFTCSSMNNHFACKPNEKINLKLGQIIVVANRSGNQTGTATYDLPLSLVHDMSKMKH